MDFDVKELERVAFAGDTLATLLRELVNEKEDRWGYWAAYAAMNDDWRAKVKLALAEWDFLKIR